MGSKIIIKWGWVAEASSFVWLIFASSPTESNLVPISIYIYIYPLTFIISDLGRVIHLRRKSEREIWAVQGSHGNWRITRSSRKGRSWAWWCSTDGARPIPISTTASTSPTPPPWIPSRRSLPSSSDSLVYCLFFHQFVFVS